MSNPAFTVMTAAGVAVDPRLLCGWVDDPRAMDEAMERNTSHPVFCMAGYQVQDSGRGKVQPLHKIVESVLGRYMPATVQTTGDCTSWGWSKIIDILKCVQIAVGKSQETFKAVTTTELLYAASRVEIGKGQLGNEAGSVGAWVAEAVRNIGTLARDVYTVGGKTYDFRVYSGDLANKLGSRGVGVPDPLESLTREHLVKSTSLIGSYEEARDSIYNGYPVAVCSQQGFTNQRDEYGFARPSGTWPHCMAFVAMDDEFRRPGLLCDNRSWGETWIAGPKRHDQPEGTFWVDADTCNKMFKGRDSFNVTGYEGYPTQDLTHILG